MVISVPGEYYVFETCKMPEREELEEFFEDKGRNDVLELRIASSSESEEMQICHVNKVYLEEEAEFMDLSWKKSGDLFEEVAKRGPYGVPMPVKDEEGNCVAIINKISTYYEHFYRYDGGIDVSFLNRYNCLVLHAMNEASVEIYKRVLPLWTGREVYLIGSEWRDYMDVFPKLHNVQVTILDEEEFPDNFGEGDGRKVLHAVEWLPMNEDNSRYQDGYICYDELMILTFMFSYVIHPGNENPDKKFFLIDGCFVIEGIYGIWLKVFTAARYALSKGYIPAFKIVSSDLNIYSDYEYDDIWNKFFLQPEGYTLEEVLKSSYLALSPNMNLLNTMRYIMDEVSAGYELAWPGGIFNERVKRYIEERRDRFLPRPERTLGVLLRGTDYSKTRMTGHARHATVEMMIEKIAEVEDSWGFDDIYLATEDSEVCERMKEYYGDRLTYTDQERFSIESGQLLKDLHEDKKEGEGFRLGAEYICTVNLLAQCDSLIASGGCGAYGEALRENGGRYRHVYKFEL